MNLEKVVFSFVVLLAATMNFGFFLGDPADPTLHSPWELYAAVAVNVIALLMKFGDRTQIGATHLATSLVAVLQLVTAAGILSFAEAQGGPTTRETVSTVVSLSGGGLLANLVSVVLLVIETVSFQRR